ncbi:hypothetical protein ABFX02_02G074000 [Erythranthe guttata]
MKKMCVDSWAVRRCTGKNSNVLYFYDCNISCGLSIICWVLPLCQHHMLGIAFMPNHELIGKKFSRELLPNYYCFGVTFLLFWVFLESYYQTTTALVLLFYCFGCFYHEIMCFKII